MRFDCIPFRDEFDVLECRLYELQDVPDLIHVIVEADRTHGGNEPKPYHLSDLMAASPDHRYARWESRMWVVKATNMPDDPDAWSREHRQREWMKIGLATLGAQPKDVVFQSDVDEIPTADAVRFTNPGRTSVVLEQRLHCFAVDWLHPQPWRGTVACRYEDIGLMAQMRDQRLTAPTVLPDAGWHLSWMGGEDAADAKMRQFCHPEIVPQWEGKLDACYRYGMHVDGTQQAPVDVDDTWPRWIVDGHAPRSWYRPR